MRKARCLSFMAATVFLGGFGFSFPTHLSGAQRNGDSTIKVWVNTSSGVYDCPGDRWYGNTQRGEYMTQGEARQQGFRPAYGRVCMSRAETVPMPNRARSEGRWSFPGAASPCGPHCGTERWQVKTLSDPDARAVNFTPIVESVADLTRLPAPTHACATCRLNGTERQVVEVRARLVGFKRETDHDFHIVIADLNNANDTMIVEIPDPACGGVCSSIRLNEIGKARGEFARKFPAHPPDNEFVEVPGNAQVEITGVGFFDFYHGQIGVAKNCIEIHPVLAVGFPDPGPLETERNPAEKPEKHQRDWYRCLP